MTPVRTTLFAVSCAALAACVTTTEPSPASSDPATIAPAPTTIPPEATPGVSEGLAIGTLPAQRMVTGQCGLFLFTPKPAPRFVFFAEAASGTGKIMLNGRELALARTSVDGNLVNQHYSTQTYQSADEIKVEVTFVAGDAAESGTSIDSGKLRVDRADGWSAVLPVSGATSCQ